MTSRAKYEIPIDRMNQLKSLLMRIKINPSEYFKEKASHNSDAINEALTHTSAQLKYNHENLEFLGDAVLRLAASEFIEQKFPNMSVGDRSALRSELVSDRWLTKVGKSIKIDEVFVIGPKAAGDASALATLQAEATEALIGAIYKHYRDLTQIHNWLNPYWEEESINVLNDPHRNNSKSALQEWSQSKGLKLPKYDIKELSIDKQLIDRIFKFASIKHILNNYQNNEEKIFDLL